MVETAESAGNNNYIAWLYGLHREKNEWVKVQTLS